MKTKVCFVLFLLLSYSLVGAQNNKTISGHVYDQKTKEPVFNVNVFLANTTIGAASGMDGYFIMEKVPPGSYQLIAHHIGYEIYNGHIKIENSSVKDLKIPLKPIVLKGETIQVEAKEPTEWRKDLERFKLEFLGKTPNSNLCIIKNPEVLDFTTDEETKKFKATTDSVLIIENYALGYRLHIILEFFEWTQYSTGQYLIIPRFEKLTPQSPSEANTWEQRRLETYQGSLRHYLSALAQNKLNTEFFQTYMEKNTESSIKNVFLFDIFKFVKDAPNGLKKLQFPHYIRVVYKKRVKDSSWLRLNAEYALFDSLGYLHTPSAFTKYGYWTEARIADLLPFDYQPPENKDQN